MNGNKDVFQSTQHHFDHGSNLDSHIDSKRFLVYDGVSKGRLPKVNDLVDVLWDAQNEWFRGRLLKQRGRIRVFRFDILYDDGDFLTHDLNEEHWRFVNDMTKTYEPGEIEELRRDLEEKSFSIATAGSIRKQRKPGRRDARTTNSDPTQSMSALPSMVKRRMPKRVVGRNDSMKSDSMLPTLINTPQNEIDFTARRTIFQPINEATSQVSFRSIDNAHFQTTGHCHGMDISSTSGVGSVHRNDETHLPFRKRRVVRPNRNGYHI